MTDYWNCTVIKFNSTGGFITSWGTYGAGEGQFDYPSGIAVGPGDAIFVADTLNNRIQKFDTDGTFLTTWGTAGTDNGAFDRPFGIGVNAEGLVYVADTFNNRIQVFSTEPGTVVELVTLQALPRLRGVIVEWETAAEIDNAGFNIYRAKCEGCDFVKINAEMIPARGSATQGARYRFVDNGVRNRKNVLYLLEDVDSNGTPTTHGPVKAHF